MRKKGSTLTALLLICLCVLSAAPFEQIETDHVRIIFEADDEEYARHLASFADEEFLRLSEFLGNRPDTLVPVALTSKSAVANGFFAPFPSVVNLYVTSPADRFISARTQDWLRIVFIHELTHYLHLTSPVGPAKVLSFLGPGVAALPTVFMPGWWVEGITTYSETAFSPSGGRGDSAEFSRLYQVPNAQNAMWSLSQGSYGTSFAPPNRIYVTGYLMVDYLVEHFGIEAFLEINRRFAAFPFFGISPAFKKVTGYSSKQLFAFALENSEQLTFASENLFSEPIEGNRYLVSATSKGLLGYVSDVRAGSGLYRYDLDGKARKLMDLRLDDGKSISFGFEKAVFADLWADSFHAYSMAGQPASYSDLYLLDLQSLETKRLSVRQRLVEPAISDDGRRIVASRINGPFFELVEVDQQTKQTTVLLNEDQTSYLDAALNHDGSKLAVIAIKQGNSSLLLWEKGKEIQVIVGPTSDELRSPTVLSDGSILFSLNLALYRYDGSITKVYEDPVGIMAATLNSGKLWYETYTSNGLALKSVDDQQLASERADFAPTLDIRLPVSEKSFEVKPFHDSLKFSLILPYPFVVNNDFQPGVWFHTTSYLRTQALIGSVGYSFNGNKVLSELQYSRMFGRMQLGLMLNLNTLQGFSSAATALLSIPLVDRTSLQAVNRLILQPQGTIEWNAGVVVADTTLSIGYDVLRRNRRSADFFGPSAVSVRGGAKLNIPDLTPQYYASLTGQQRLFDTSAMLRLHVDLIGAPSKTSVGNSYPLLGFESLQDGNVKVRFGTSLRIPLGLFDIPVPFGGFTAAGLEAMVQSAVYLNNGDWSWEGAWAAGLRVTGNILFGGSSISFKPFVQASYLIGLGKWSATIGLDGTDLFTIYPDRD